MEKFGGETLEKSLDRSLRERRVADFKRERLSIGTKGEGGDLLTQIRKERTGWQSRINEAREKLRKLTDEIFEICEKVNIDARTPALNLERSNLEAAGAAFLELTKQLEGVGVVQKDARKVRSKIFTIDYETKEIYRDIEEWDIKDEALAEIERDLEVKT